LHARDSLALRKRLGPSPERGGRDSHRCEQPRVPVAANGRPLKRVALRLLRQSGGILPFHVAVPLASTKRRSMFLCNVAFDFCSAGCLRTSNSTASKQWLALDAGPFASHLRSMRLTIQIHLVHSASSRMLFRSEGIDDSPRARSRALVASGS
jgi:hypothetical protein